MLNFSPLHLTLGGHEEGRAVLLNEGLGCVDQWQSVGNRVLGQSILLCQVPATVIQSGVCLHFEVFDQAFDSSVAAMWHKWKYCSRFGVNLANRT